ncbi:MAG: hypothetical protein HN778_05650 [Prolixibacteraceae bacterium]|nr:hypothetical protein [Prolixibacteraceae bacterium]MBT6999405.1 hypothetical protein [Prolixibacteraceae bacterium]MBT7394299.1 hypothetical protein [Prolixibacteraceae bacterium]
MISFGTKYWLILLLAILGATLGVVVLLYFKNKANNELSKNQLRILITLRFLSFFLIAFLLLSPFLKNLKKITQNPIIIAAWDNSGSIVSTVDSVRVASEINQLKNKIENELGSSYSLINYLFGEETSLGERLDFTGKKSDYNELISTVHNNHFNENIGALIIAGDGIYNQGKNPANLTGEINFPVFTIGLGDTTGLVDSRIENIRVNRTSFSGNHFPVEIDAQFSKLKGQPLKLAVKQGDSELASIVITPPNNNYFYSRQFTLEAGAPGLKHYSVTIESVQNERNTKNNEAGFVINVLESKQKILILSDGPHPDIGAVKNTLDLQKTYEVSVFTEEPYPSNLSDFNLVILNQLPTSGKSLATIIKTAENSRIPILFIVGNKTFLPQLNMLAQGAQIVPLAGLAEEAQATLNPTFATFSLSEDFKEMLLKFPPLQAPFAEYTLDQAFTPLFYQKIKNIETAKPLIATGTLNGRKTGFIFGEGIWRWRLTNYYFNQNHARFNELTNQLIQYLALRENEDNFIVEFKPVYAEIDDVILNAELYNDAFEGITSEEINIKLQNTEGEEFNFTFDVSGEKYYLNAGHLPIGDYSFAAEVTIGNEIFSENGSFTIVPVNLENVQTRANHQVLYQLAVQSGGNFYLPAQVEDLIRELKSGRQLKISNYFQEMVNELLNFRWLFFVLLLLLSLEWFLKKFWGIY